MKAQELPDEVQQLIDNIKSWQHLISDEVATVLVMLWQGDELTESEDHLDITASELAALWSVINKARITVDHTRHVKKEGRIQASREWGTGKGLKYHYRVADVRNVKVSNTQGRPPGSRNKKLILAQPGEEALLSLKEVAQQLQVSERTVYRLMDGQELHPSTNGNAWEFQQSDINEYIGRMNSIAPA